MPPHLDIIVGHERLEAHPADLKTGPQDTIADSPLPLSVNLTTVDDTTSLLRLPFRLRAQAPVAAAILRTRVLSSDPVTRRHGPPFDRGIDGQD
jgi:hypothetical protein